MKKLSQAQFDAKLNMAIALLAECSASVNLDSAMDMIAGGEAINFDGYGTVPDTVWAHLEHWDIAERVSKATQELQKGVDPKYFMKDNATADQPKATTRDEFQADQAKNVTQLIRQMILNGTNGRLSCPTGIGRTMILTLACNELVKDGLHVVYASPMQAMVEQMKEYGPNFHAMTYREFAQRDKEEVPCEIVIYDDAKDMTFGEEVLAIRL